MARTKNPSAATSKAWETRRAGGFVVAPSGIAASLNKAAKSQARHEAAWRRRGLIVPVGTKLRSGRTDLTLIEPVKGDRFWVSDSQKRVIANALKEIGEPYKALVNQIRLGRINARRAARGRTSIGRGSR